MTENLNFKFQKENPESFLVDSFSQEDRIYLNSAVKLGYELVTETMEKAPWLQVLRAKEIEPRMKSYAVEYMVIQYIKKGLLNLNYRIEYTSKKNNSYIVFFNDDDTLNLIINQVNSKKKPSRFAQYRFKKYNEFESYFDLFTNDFNNEQPVYIELNHGYQSKVPSFTILGIPKSQTSWYASIPIMEEYDLIQTKNPNFKTKEIELPAFDFDDFKQFIEERDVQ